MLTMYIEAKHICSSAHCVYVCVCVCGGSVSVFYVFIYICLCIIIVLQMEEEIDRIKMLNVDASKRIQAYKKDQEKLRV